MLSAEIRNHIRFESIEVIITSLFLAWYVI